MSQPAVRSPPPFPPKSVSAPLPRSAPLPGLAPLPSSVTQNFRSLQPPQLSYPPASITRVVKPDDLLVNQPSNRFHREGSREMQQPLVGEVIDLTEEVGAGKTGGAEKVVVVDVKEGVEVIVMPEVDNRSDDGSQRNSKEDKDPPEPPFKLHNGVQGSGEEASNIPLHQAASAADGGVDEALTVEEHLVGRVTSGIGASSHIQGDRKASGNAEGAQPSRVHGTTIKGQSSEVPGEGSPVECGEVSISDAPIAPDAGSVGAARVLFDGGRQEAAEDPSGSDLDIDLEPHQYPEVDPPVTVRMTELEREEWRQRQEVSSHRPCLLRLSTLSLA